MLADFCPHVWQTSVAKFYLTSVDEGVESGPPREVFVKQPEKFLSHIGFEVHTVWGVKPNNFALPFLFWEHNLLLTARGIFCKTAGG